MIVNPKKFQVIFISKKKNALPTNVKPQINNTEITSQLSVELLGVTNNELNLSTTLAGFANQFNA